MVRKIGFLLLVAFILTLIWKFWPLSRDEMVTVAIDGDPVTIAAFKKKDSTLILITLPATLNIEVSEGLGTYPISSLWQLGDHQGVGGEIIRRSLEELLALNIQFFLKGTQQGIHEVFRLRQLPRILSGDLKTNMNVFAFLWFIWRLGAVAPDRELRIAIPESLATSEILPDGSIRFVVVPAAVDTVISDEFEEAGVRSEKLTISVMNTGQTPLLAEQVARKVSRIGGNVVRTGNEQSDIDTCQIRGGPDAIKSQTAQALKKLLGCIQVKTEGELYSDLTILTR